MSLHSSLRHGGSKGHTRTVLKREERIKKLIAEGKWSKESSVFGLPKTKIVRMKIAKKEKKQEAGEKKEEQKKE